jgi:hypothetical protein
MYETVLDAIDVEIKAAPIIEEIDRLRDNIVGNTLHIGTRLKELRGVYGARRFSNFMRRLPDYGISRSTGYRWMVLAEKLALLFPNSVVCNELMRMIDGRGILTGPGKDRKDPDAVDPAHTVLTPAAREALSALPPIPEQGAKEHESRQWAQKFIKAMNKSRARQRAEERAARRNPEKEQEAILRKLERLAAGSAPEAVAQLRERIQRLFGAHDGEHDAAASAEEFQSQVGIGAAASNPNASKSTLAQPKSLFQANVSQSPAVSQSQVGTESASQTPKTKTARTTDWTQVAALIGPTWQDQEQLAAWPSLLDEPRPAYWTTQEYIIGLERSAWSNLY